MSATVKLDDKLDFSFFMDIVERHGFEVIKLTVHYEVSLMIKYSDCKEFAHIAALTHQTSCQYDYMSLQQYRKPMNYRSEQNDSVTTLLKAIFLFPPLSRFVSEGPSSHTEH